jgi:hypothetical protein
VANKYALPKTIPETSTGSTVDRRTGLEVTAVLLANLVYSEPNIPNKGGICCLFGRRYLFLIETHLPADYYYPYFINETPVRRRICFYFNFAILKSLHEGTMRLLNTSDYSLQEFWEPFPEYAILSHTWEKEEVLFPDLQGPSLAAAWNTKKGAVKVKGFCELARQDGYQWVWIDTCCIDKSSSSELGEAINSMYSWYRQALVCYVYLSDVHGADLHDEHVRKLFQTSRWFTRGWTLQELLAPRFVEFYDRNWTAMGSKMRLAGQISEITGINSSALLHRRSLESFPVATRMCWASNRQTTRSEDTAYCLLGIFQINMPLLYGEGTKAFRRLQEEVLRSVEDYSLLAWESPVTGRSVLAPSPSSFSYLNNVELLPAKWAHSRTGVMPDDPSTIAARGVRLSLPIVGQGTDELVVFLRCSIGSGSEQKLLTLNLQFSHVHKNYVRRIFEPIRRFNFRESWLQKVPTVMFGSTDLEPKSENVANEPGFLMLLLPNSVDGPMLLTTQGENSVYCVMFAYGLSFSHTFYIILVLRFTIDNWESSLELLAADKGDGQAFFDEIDSVYVHRRLNDKANLEVKVTNEVTVQFQYKRITKDWVCQQNKVQGRQTSDLDMLKDNFLAKLTVEGGTAENLTLIKTRTFG